MLCSGFRPDRILALSFEILEDGKMGNSLSPGQVRGPGEDNPHVLFFS